MTWKTRLAAPVSFYKESKIAVTQQHPAVGATIQPTRNVDAASAPAPNGPSWMCPSPPPPPCRIRRSVRKSAERNQAPYNLPVDSPSIVRPQRSFAQCCCRIWSGDQQLGRFCTRLIPTTFAHSSFFSGVNLSTEWVRFSSENNMATPWIDEEK